MISSLAPPIVGRTTEHGGVRAGEGRFRAFLDQLLRVMAVCLPLSRRALAVRVFVPRRYWFRAALLLSRAQGRVVGSTGGNGRLSAAVMLDLWLRELSFGGAFPLPMRVTGAEVVLSEGPKLLTWTHLPLCEVALRAWLDAGAAAPAVVADRGCVLEERDFLVYGAADRVEAIPLSGCVLSRVRSTLRRGVSVAFPANRQLGHALSDAPLRLSAELGVPVMLPWAVLGTDGVIEVTFEEAPFPWNRSEAEIAGNVEVLAARDRAVLAELGR